jgi:hypothetical protein
MQHGLGKDELYRGHTPRRGDFVEEIQSEKWARCRLIFPSGMSHGRNVIGHDGRNESNCLASLVPCGHDWPRHGTVGTRTLCQPSLVRSPDADGHTQLRRCPSLRNMLLTSSTCTPKPYFAKPVKDHSPLIRSGEIGSGGTFICRS